MVIGEKVAKRQSTVGGTVRQGLLLLSVAAMAMALYLIFLWVPTEQNLGVSQRIFYFHVPMAWAALLSIIVVAIGGAGYLLTGKEKWDSLAFAAAENGILFGGLTLVTGSIWAKPIWGVWWTWDAKLTTTLILWFILVGYMMVRSYAPSGSQGRRFASIVGVIGSVDAPIVYFASQWWRTAHPELLVGPVAEPGRLEGSMFVTLMVSVVAFTALFAYLVSERYALKQAEKELDRLYIAYA